MFYRRVLLAGGILLLSSQYMMPQESLEPALFYDSPFGEEAGPRYLRAKPQLGGKIPYSPSYKQNAEFFKQTTYPVLQKGAKLTQTQLKSGLNWYLDRELRKKMKQFNSILEPYGEQIKPIKTFLDSDAGILESIDDYSNRRFVLQRKFDEKLLEIIKNRKKQRATEASKGLYRVNPINPDI